MFPFALRKTKGGLASLRSAGGFDFAQPERVRGCKAKHEGPRHRPARRHIFTLMRRNWSGREEG